jgi:P27 family predicted phage terminase small subunit
MKNSDSNTHPAPKHLTQEARRWWDKICAGWELDDPALLLLESGLESFDRMRQAQAVLKKEGAFIRDRFNQRRSHPALLVERDAKLSLIKNLKALNLDLEPIQMPGRPPGGKK